MIGSAPVAGDRTGGRRAWVAAACAVGAAAGLGSAWGILAGDLRLGGGVAAVAGAALVAGRALSDGDVRARLFVSLADRLVDGAMLGAVAWWAREREPAAAAGALLALATSALAAYVRARGGALGYGVPESLGVRAVQVAWLAVALLAGWERWGLLALAAWTAGVVAVRVSQVVKEERA